MALDFLNTDESEAPPDVGREDEYEEKKRKEKGENISGSEKKAEELGKTGNKLIGQIESGNTEISANSAVSNDVSSEKTRFEFEKINAKIEANNAFLKVMNERFSNVNQQIGELRAMTLSNEKSISKSNQDSLRAVDIVKEVQPDKLRADFQKLDLKMSSLDEKLTANKQYSESLMEEFKEIKRKAGLFDSQEAVLKLNEEVKKDLVELQKMAAKVRLNTDKSEQIFLELRKGFAESEKTSQIISSLDSSYSGLGKEVEKLKLDYSSILSLQDFEDFKKHVSNKLALFENKVLELDIIKKDNERMMELIEKTLLIAKRNQDDVADMAIAIGDDNVKKVADYEDEISSILRIVDGIAGQISEIKEKVGIEDNEKILVEHNGEKVIGLDKVNLKNVEVSPELSKPFIRKNNIPFPKAGFYGSQDIDRLLEKGKNLLISGRTEEAKRIYAEIRKIYNPENNQDKSKYKRIMEFYNLVSNVFY